MKIRKTELFLCAVFLGMMVASAINIQAQTPDFEIVVPWGLDHPRGQIIKSMIDNSSLAGSYNFIYTQVGGGPSDRDALTARFLAGDYPDLILCTQDWYTEFSEFGIFVDFSDMIASWAGTARDSWRTDIPAGWWTILDEAEGDGTGDNILALPFFGQSVLPYINTDHFTAAGIDWDTEMANLADWDAACAALDAIGVTPFAMVGTAISDLAYMNYMFGSTDNYISSRRNPATVYPWDDNGDYGVNGTLSVEGLELYLKMKGEGWVPSTVDTTGGGDANTLFGQNKTSMVLCGPWGTDIFESTAKEAGFKLNFTVIPMPACSDGVRSTIIGGGMSMVPKATPYKTDAMALAQWLLEDENQMKTVDNWLRTAWRIPVRMANVAGWDTWVAASPENRSNFEVHVDSQDYAYAWGKQHPKWISIHESVMIPGYYDALQGISWNTTGQDYAAAAQAALDDMALEIETNWLPSIPTSYYTTITQIQTSIVVSQQTTVITQIITSIVRAPGFTFGVILAIFVAYGVLKRSKKK